MVCNIIKKDGKVIYTEAPNGNRSKLFDALHLKFGNTVEALDVWMVSKTKEFTKTVINPIKAKNEIVSVVVTSPIEVLHTKRHFAPRINYATGEVLGGIEGQLLTTPPEFRGQGAAKAAITEFLEYTDSIGEDVYIVLSPRDAVTTTDKLAAMHRPFGFVSTSEFEMVRKAKKTAPLVKVNGLDKNGEIEMETLLEYVDIKSSKENISQEEIISEVNSVMVGLPVESAEDLRLRLKTGFMSEGYFKPSRESLLASGLYNSEEITLILTGEEIQENIKEFIRNLDKLETELFNDQYIDDAFLLIEDGTLNGIGKPVIFNPFIVEKEAVNELGAMESRDEFEAALADSNFAPLLESYYKETKNTKDDLYIRFSKFSEVAEISDKEGLEVKTNNTREFFDQVLSAPENSKLQDSLAYLIELDSDIYESNEEDISTLIKELSVELAKVGIDSSELQNKSKTKSVAELKEFMIAVSDMIIKGDIISYNNLIGAYNNYFDVMDTVVHKKVMLNKRVDSNNTFLLSTTVPNITSFTKEGLIPVGKALYKRTAEVSTKELYEQVYLEMTSSGYTNIFKDDAVKPTGMDSDGSLNLNKILDPKNKESILEDMKHYVNSQLRNVFVGEEIVSIEELEKYVILFNYYNRSNNYNKFNKTVVLKEESETLSKNITNIDYLKSDFIAEFNIKGLQEKLKDSKIYRDFYSNFSVDSTGIVLLNNDPVTLNKVIPYLKDNQDLVNYFRVNKRRENLPAEEIVDILPFSDDLTLRNIYSNFPELVKAFRGDYTRLNTDTILGKTKEDFVRLSDGVYELVEGIGNQSIYGKLNMNLGEFVNYDENMSPPVIEIDVTELAHIDANIVNEIEISNLYSAKEGEAIRDKHDDC